MEQILKTIYRNLLKITPTHFALYIIYFRGYRKILNMKNPTHFGEKIQWLKLYGNLDQLSEYVDKYEVRKYVRATIGDEFLNELYGCYETPEEIDYSKLPDKFVLKCTNGSGDIIICKDKEKLDRSKICKQMRKWLKVDFSKIKKEPQYKNIHNRIIAEKYLEDSSGALIDYKFYCYDGKPLYYGIFMNRYTNKTVDMYDISGNKLEGIRNGNVGNSLITCGQSHGFKEMIKKVTKLAKPFQFVRVDFYLIDDKPVFGELTFTDGAGSEPFYPESFDLEMGSRIKLASSQIISE